METKKKKEYAAPVTDVVELKTEGVLCGSGGLNNPNDYGFGSDPFSF